MEERITIAKEYEPVDATARHLNLIKIILNSQIKLFIYHGPNDSKIPCWIISRFAFEPVRIRYFAGRDTLLNMIFVSNEVPNWLLEHWFWHEINCNGANCLHLYEMEREEIQEHFSKEKCHEYLQCRIDMLEDILKVEPNHPQKENLAIALQYFEGCILQT